MTTKAKETKAPALKLITGNTALMAAVTSIVKRGKKWDSDVQQLALSLANHVELHGDITLANRLINEFPKGARKTALAEWFVAYAKLSLNESTSKADRDASPFVYDKTKNTDLVAGALMNWYECGKPEKLEDIYDFQKALQSILKRAANATLADGQTELLQKVQALMAE